jgi:hypothetical protein
MSNTNKQYQIEYVDTSSLDTFAGCPFKYMLSRLEGVEEKDREKIFLSYGTILHECLPMCYKCSLEEVLDRFASRWATTTYGEEDPKRNSQTAGLLLENFWNNHHGSTCAYEPLDLNVKTVETVDKVSEGEIPFLIDIGGVYPYAGRIDLPVRLKADGSYWALDFKTSSEVSERFFGGFINHPQTLGYTLALLQLANKPINGLIIEAVRVASIPKRPSKVPPNQWHPIYVPEHKLHWFMEWAKRLSQHIASCNEHKFWPRNPSACNPYSMFGMPGYTCKYKNICEKPQENWMDELRWYNTGNPWHPFEIAKEK